MPTARNGQDIITGVYVTPLSPPVSAEQKAYIKDVLLKNADKFMERVKPSCAHRSYTYHISNYVLLIKNVICNVNLMIYHIL